MLVLAQTTETVSAVGDVIKTSSQFGQDAFLTVILLALIGVCAGMYVWYVAIPNGKSHRDNSEKLTGVIEGMAGQSSSTLEHAVVIRTSTNAIQKQIDRLVDCKRLEIVAIQKVADSCNVDVTAELSELKGRLT